MKRLVAWTPSSYSGHKAQVFSVKWAWLKGQVGWKSMPRHRAVAVLGRGVLSNSHRGALTAAWGSHMREGLVPTGLRSSSKR